MDKLNLILIVSDIFLMGVVIFLLFRMRSTPPPQSVAPRSEDAVEAELQKVKTAAKSLEIKRAEMDSLGLEIKEKQDHLESVIGKVEAVIDTMAMPAGGDEAGASPQKEPSRGETLVMARQMISEGRSIDEISAELKLYRGELELIKSLDKISSK